MVLRHQDIKGNILRRDFEEKFDLIVDANDSILERVVRTLLNPATSTNFTTVFKIIAVNLFSSVLAFELIGQNL
jgi:hypothetical protein